MNIKINQNAFKKQKTNAQFSYSQEKIVGKGGFGTITKLINHQGQQRALKKIQKLNNKDQALNEIKILQQLDHPNILKLYEFYEHPDEYCIITDYWEGGDLYEYIGNHQYLQEQEISQIIRQLLSVLNYVHNKKIIHRDIKSENILVQDTQDGILIKLIDWGISEICESTLSLIIGTTYYMAPEVLRQCYDFKADLWSTGVLVYELVTGELPFYSRNIFDVSRLIIESKIVYDHNQWKMYSPDMLDFVQNLLQKDTKKRLSAAEALQHPFIQGSRQRSKSHEFNEQLQQNMTKLKEFNIYNKFQQAVLTYLAMHNTDQNQINFIKTFNELDKNSDGRLTVDELSAGLQQLFNLDSAQANLQALSIMNNLDIDDNGYIDYSEFVMACSKNQELLSEEKLQEAFKIFDINDDGKISVEELKQIFIQQEQINEMKWQTIIDEVDKDGDGQISYGEFLEIMQGIH